MKEKIFILLVCLFSTTFFMNAQQGGDTNKKFDIEEYKQRRAKFLIKEIGLTEKEAKEFLPISDEMVKRKFDLNKEYRNSMRNLRDKKNISDKEYEKIIDQGLDIRIKEAQLEKEYYAKFKKVLSAEKLFKYQKAEEKFMKSEIERHRKRSKAH